MDPKQRTERLLADHALLQKLSAGSSILKVESFGEPADRYVFTFRGKGLARDVTQTGEISIVELHQVEVRLPYAYPTSPPDIRWLTPILHPNISFSGFVNLNEMGLPWMPDVGLDVICERLWDMARSAYLNLDRATNYSAKNWYEDECKHQLPVDSRPLRSAGSVSTSNIVSYSHRAGEGVRWTSPAATGEVLFIDENTPVPNSPGRKQRGAKGKDDDVFYIGPE
ncbi:Ubiquitin-conjugating enzyme [Anatilimnocola aggregata]|uniref:Ubiquitin-conjugating enzyme n=1 Tax=Anatilimnocola aggregata TaxID=2528021 RepID=A0A517Y5G8_9BACT|nr:ubiquitin-conjugating enzyme E2 [Anatilimnocola aggregata]QDU25491.1 Ubiquitin-conjugating enzyme [Anatilimnocola aggregata]